jgi:protein phosphatase
MGRRDSQQDAALLSSRLDADFVAHAGQLAVLADGMGGMRNGHWAAQQAAQAFVEAYLVKTASETPAAALQRALHVANAVVHDEAGRLGVVDRMGTTLAVAVLRGCELHWLNVGDSRVYLAEEGRLKRLSVDHNYGEMLHLRVQRGELGADEAQAHPLRHALTSYLGRPEPVLQAASAAPVLLRPGAWVLLCSDGLTQALDDGQIAAQLHGQAAQACERLLQAALRGLSDQDNITVAAAPATDRSGTSCSRRRRRRRTCTCNAPAPHLHLHPAAAAPAAPLSVPAYRRWREPLWWAGAAAALGALSLLWLARQGAPEPVPMRPQQPSVDLLAPAASRPASAPRAD